jgi:hypothetical protein
LQVINCGTKKILEQKLSLSETWLSSKRANIVSIIFKINPTRRLMQVSEPDTSKSLVLKDIDDNNTDNQCCYQEKRVAYEVTSFVRARKQSWLHFRT